MSAACLGGFSKSSVGTAFLADGFVIIGSLWAIPKVWSSNPETPRRALFALLLLAPLVFVGLDLANHVPLANLIKGGGRNLVFCGAVVFAYLYCYRYGIDRCLVLLMCAALSYSLAVRLGFGDENLREQQDLTDYLKFHNLINAVVFVYAFFEFSKLVGFAATLGAGLFLATIADYRSGAAYVLAPLFVLLCVILARRFSSTLLCCLIAMAAAIAVPVANKLYLDPRYFGEEAIERRELSNAGRAEMVKFSWNEFLLNPLTGYGSWSNANRFQSRYTDDQMSVHSILLQYLYEYGLLGGVFILFWGAVALRSFRNTLTIYSQMEDIPLWSLFTLSFIWFQFLFNLAMGSLLGYTRITLGIAGGILLYITHLRPHQVRRAGLQRGFTRSLMPAPARRATGG